MPATYTVELTPEQVETIHRWADDAYVWQERVRFEHAGRNTSEGFSVAREAWEKGNVALRIMAALRPAREEIAANSIT